MTSNISLSITYTYHPMPPLLKQDMHHVMLPSPDDLSTMADGQEGEFIQYNPLKPDTPTEMKTFDAGTMDSDLIAVELEVAPTVLCLYGSLLRNFLHVKVRALRKKFKKLY